jgi:dTDP-glucose pyrophosphorylase
MGELIGVIPAAGRGTRAYPYTRCIPKCMLEVDGEPNLARSIAIMRDQLGIRRIVVVVGAFSDAIRQYFGDGTNFGVELVYVQNQHVDKGLSHSILLSKPYAGDYLCVMLGDECYVASNHDELLRTDYTRYLATCAVKATNNTEQIRKNYAADVEGGQIRRIVEKPESVGRSLLGLGTFLLHRSIYDHLQQALEASDGRPTDPVSVLGRLCTTHEIAPFFLRGDYVNINDRDDLNLANNLVRSRQFERRSLSLALIMRGSLESTARSLADFHALGRFQQIVLVRPQGVGIRDLPVDNTDVVTARSGAYGDMLRAGLDACRGDILFAAFSDGSFSPHDVPKFLEYLKEADLVVGTRTTRQLVHQGTNMRGVVRLGHIAIAKILELIWLGYGPSFTDVGCTYRALWRSTYELIRPQLADTVGPEYSVGMLLETLNARKRVIEIPVNFRLPRRGIKEHDQRLTTVLAMLALIVTRRIHSAPAGRSQPAGARHEVPALRPHNPS